MILYAGIGSRNTPPDVQSKMMGNASYYAYQGYGLRSGKAIGSDQAYEAGAKLQNGWVETFTAEDDLPMWTFIFTEFFHPAPYRLTTHGRRLMCRNAMIMLGRDGNSPVDFVECYTPSGNMQGGTSQAMRIATYFKIPIYNLGSDDYDRHTTLL